jgi:HD-like signal output (HDOD) protein
MLTRARTLPFFETPSLTSWTEYFSHVVQNANLPVLAETSEALEAMRLNEDKVDANLLGEVISADPLMTLKVQAYAASHRSKRLLTDTETVTAALVMMGISPFFREFGLQPTVEDHLADQPEALAGLQEVMQRAHRAATFALSFAVHRMDHDAPVVYQAALLHDFADMLMWCHAPALALEMRHAQKADATLRSSAVQEQMLGVKLPELQHALMLAWRLPDLLVRCADDSHAEHPSVKSVALATRLARHTAQGWDNAAIPDDVREIAELLNMSEPATLAWLLEVDA